MSMKIKAAILVTSFAVLLFVVVGSMGGVHASSNDGSYRQLQVYSEVLSRVRSGVRRRAEHSQGDGWRAAWTSGVARLQFQLHDRPMPTSHSRLTRRKARLTSARWFRSASDTPRSWRCCPGSPAEKAGIEATDIFESIEGRARAKCRCPKFVTSSAELPAPPECAGGPRAQGRAAEGCRSRATSSAFLPSTDKMMDDGIGYMKVEALTKGKAQELASKIKSLEKSGAKKILLDLRYCAEGDESEGVAAANLFLNHGTITYLQGQKFPREAFNAEPSKSITTLPVAVLVNRGTSGASEIVAAAILENARGDVVGDKTFGDGSVQKTIDLPDGGALILSVAKYYSPSGKAIQDAAVTPNGRHCRRGR